MENLVSSIAGAINALAYYVAAAVSVIVKNRYLLIMSVLVAFGAIINPTLKIGRLLNFSAKR